jgi:hypothetical protein
MHHAPEIDVEQPVHLRLVDLAELAEQGDAGIVDENVERGVGRGRGLREVRDLFGLGDIGAVGRDLAPGIAADLGTACKPASSRSANARS